MSLPEVLLWQQLRGKRSGLKFRRQHPIGSYVADFYCRDVSLVIEVDGECHNRGDRPKRDEARARFMADNGYRVVRVAAGRILADPAATADAIAALVSTPLHHASHGPPPRSGEDQE